MKKSKHQRVHELYHQVVNLRQKLQKKQLCYQVEKDARRRQKMNEEIVIIRVRIHLKELQLQFEIKHGK